MQVMPSRVDDLKDGILRCQRRHRAILKALFDTTLSTLELNHIQQPQYHDLTSFLEANDISADRFFNPSTLPSTDPLQSSRFSNAPRPKSHWNQAVTNKDSDQAPGKHGEYHGSGVGTAGSAGGGTEELGPATAQLANKVSSTWLPNGTSIPQPALERSSAAVQQRSPPAEELDPVASARTPEKQVVTFEACGQVQNEAVSSSSNNIGFTTSPFSEELVDEQRSRPTRNELSPPTAIQEDRSGPIDQEKDVDKTSEGPREGMGETIPNDLAPLTLEEAIEQRPDRKVEQYNASTMESKETLKQQMPIAGTRALDVTASTPDEQLRLEEAHSMQLAQAAADIDRSVIPSIPTPVNPSSDFVQESIADRDSIADIAGANNEVIAKQDDGNQYPQINRNDLSTGPIVGLRGSLTPGMNSDSSRDLTLSRRPPMRIDTGMTSASESMLATDNAFFAKTIPASSEATILNKTASAAATAQSPPERMTTRVSSGALRHKSVSEILGETPKSAPVQNNKSAFSPDLESSPKEDHNPLQTPKSASSLSSDPTAFRRRLSELKEKERSKLSTVVFASSRNADLAQNQQAGEEDFQKGDRDYMLTLFNFQVASPPRAHSLNALVKSAHKTLTTADHFTDFNERQGCRILNKIYELQARNCWSLRQVERSVEPSRPVTHLDVLMSEMKWMRTDFKEERKWKMAAAKFTADACAVWVAGTPKERKFLQVKIRAVPVDSKSKLDSMSNPDPIHTTSDEASELSDEGYISDPGNAPAAIFSLPPEMFVFGLKQSPVAEKLLLELPLYQPNADIQDAALRVTDLQPDAAWKKALAPTTKYAQGKIVPISNSSYGKAVSLEEGPPRKRSRYDYQAADTCQSHPRSGSYCESEQTLEPEQDDVALFDPEHKHIRDRIHSGHAFRPPSEHIMPSQSFFESRQSSQWTQAEDDELRRVVKEYTYNWSLISSSMTLPSRFTSGSERRTPWECFERWISLEGLPVEMAKIHYFRAYTARLQAAQKTVESNYLAQQQQQSASGAQLPLRKRTTQPYNVERRKEQRHLHLIDAMRKLAKKREAALNKQQQVARSAAMRKAHEGPKVSREIRTPQEFSRMKHSQQLKLEENQRQYRAQILQHQKAVQAAKANQQAGQHTNGVQAVRNPLPGAPNGSSPNMTGGNAHGHLRGNAADPSRAVPPIQRVVNGSANGVLPPHPQGVPHAPMQPNAQLQVQMQPRMAAGVGPDTRVMQEVSRVQAQQQAFQQQIRQQGHPQTNGHAGSPNMQSLNHSSHNNAASLPQSVQGRSSPSANGAPNPTGTSISPRMGQPQALSSGLTPAVNHITSSIKARHPQASQEQINRMANDQLYKMSTHNAMQAAAGNANINAVNSNSNIALQAPSPMQQAALMANGGSPILNPAHYAQIMRTQQASQQRSANGGTNQSANGNGMNGAGSRSVTPLIQRTSSAQGVPRPSQSPNARPVGLAK